LSRRILVTGATGFIGRHLVAGLVARGFSVRAAVRRRVTDGAFPASLEQIVTGDLAEEIDWWPLLIGIDAIVHLAAIAHVQSPLREDVYDRVNRWAAVRLAKVATSAGIRLVFISSVAAQSAPSADEIITEEMIPNPVSAYGRSKLRAEQEISAFNGNHVILRPTITYGAGVKGNMKRILDLALLPLPLPVAALRKRRSLLAIENLIDAITLVLTPEVPRNEIFLVADPEPVTVADIVAEIRRGAGRKSGLIPVPRTLMRAGLRVLGGTDLLDRIDGNLIVSTAKLQAVGFTPRVRTPDGLAALGAQACRTRHDVTRTPHRPDSSI
jgi:nucleoside-diphosphate-sugar epimerase